MDIPLNAEGLFRLKVTLLSAATMPNPDTPFNRYLIATVQDIIDALGKRSGYAQHLKTAVTSFKRLSESNHRVYCIKQENNEKGLDAIVGMIKMGVKKLFVVNLVGEMKELELLCVLDFYVHEDYQRLGYGRELFDVMLKMEHANSDSLAYDRPSPKMLSFLAKHFNLTRYISQANNFVIFMPALGGDIPMQPTDANNNSRFSSIPPNLCTSGPGSLRPFILSEVGLVAKSLPQIKPGISKGQVRQRSGSARTNSFSASRLISLANDRHCHPLEHYRRPGYEDKCLGPTRFHLPMISSTQTLRSEEIFTRHTLGQRF